MSLYQKLINDLAGKKAKGKSDTEDLYETIDNIDISQLEEEITSKIGDFKENAPLFELLFMDALKKADLDTDNITANLTEKEKQMILNMVTGFINQFDDLEQTSKVDSPNDEN